MKIAFFNSDGAYISVDGSLNLNSIDKVSFLSDGFIFRLLDPKNGIVNVFFPLSEFQKMAILANDLFIETQKEK